MPFKVFSVIGFLGLNICLSAGQDESWEQHLRSAMKLRTQTLYKDAEKEYLVAIKEAEAFGPSDTRLAKSWNNLAALYQELGRYGDAESFFLRAAALWERELGPDSQDLASCLNNLAAVYRDQGRYPEAESLYLRSLSMRENNLPP